MTKVVHHSCTIQRTVLRTLATLDMRSGQTEERGSETVTDACGLPLFVDQEKERGICRSCAAGWTVESNKFATQAEYVRATNNKMS